MPSQQDTIAEITVEIHAGVVDQDIERLDALDRRLNLRGVGPIEAQGCDALVGVGQGLASTDIHSCRTSPQGFLDQRLPDAAVGPGHQNCSVCDRHRILLPEPPFRRAGHSSLRWRRATGSYR
jgi:hypothetical protein